MNSSAHTPRLPIVIEGSSLRHIAPSADSTKSARSSRAFAAMTGSRFRLPISSSPSQMNFMLRGRARDVTATLGVAAHARDVRELDQLLQGPIVVDGEIFERRHRGNTALSRSSVW